jgi:hypothetical protein
MVAAPRDRPDHRSTLRRSLVAVPPQDLHYLTGSERHSPYQLKLIFIIAARDAGVKELRAV